MQEGCEAVKRRWFLAGSLFVSFLLAGCGLGEQANWYDTERKAMEAGLLKEGTDESAILSTEKVEGETIVFYEYMGALGTASITETRKGYSWFRNEPYLDFETEGSLPYTTAGFEMETKSGLKIPVLAGKILDPSVKGIKLVRNGVARELSIPNGSDWFYAINEELTGPVEVIPVQ